VAWEILSIPSSHPRLSPEVISPETARVFIDALRMRERTNELEMGDLLSRNEINSRFQPNSAIDVSISSHFSARRFPTKFSRGSTKRSRYLHLSANWIKDIECGSTFDISYSLFRRGPRRFLFPRSPSGSPVPPSRKEKAQSRRGPMRARCRHGISRVITPGPVSQ